MIQRAPVYLVVSNAHTQIAEENAATKNNIMKLIHTERD